MLASTARRCCLRRSSLSRWPTTATSGTTDRAGGVGPRCATGCWSPTPRAVIRGVRARHSRSGLSPPFRAGGGANELIDRLRQQVGRLDIAPEELEGRNQRSALFKTMFLAFRAARRKGLALERRHRARPLRRATQAAVPSHLPEGGSEGRRARRAKLTTSRTSAFIGGKTNRQISDKPPRAVLSPADREVRASRHSRHSAFQPTPDYSSSMDTRPFFNSAER